MKKQNGVLQDKEQAKERLEAELKAALSRALEAEENIVEVSLRLEEHVAKLEQGCWAVGDFVLQLEAKFNQVISLAQ